MVLFDDGPEVGSGVGLVHAAVGARAVPAMFEQAHAFGVFDLVVDTSAAPPQVTAGRVLAHLLGREPATALPRLHGEMFGRARQDDRERGM